MADESRRGGIASTPAPPYTAVIFTSIQTEDNAGYLEMAEQMEQLVSRQPGYLGMETARAELGITVSYWKTEADAQAWKNVVEHKSAQRLGATTWYRSYRVRVATVSREYGHVTETP